MPAIRSHLMPIATASLVTRGLRLCETLSHWPAEVLAHIAAGSHLERYERGVQVLAQNPLHRDLLVVVSGAIELSGINASGSRFVLARSGPGVMVNLVRLLPGLASVYHCHALEDTLLVHIPADHLREVLDENPLLWRDMAMLALSRQQESIVTLQRRGFGRLDQSLAQALLSLIKTQQSQGNGGLGIRLRISQGDLASMVSVSRQTVNKGLRLLTDAGILSVAYGELQIRDPSALQRLAETGIISYEEGKSLHHQIFRGDEPPVNEQHGGR